MGAWQVLHADLVGSLINSVKPRPRDGVPKAEGGIWLAEGHAALWQHCDPGSQRLAVLVLTVTWAWTRGVAGGPPAGAQKGRTSQAKTLKPLCHGPKTKFLGVCPSAL